MSDRNDLVCEQRNGVAWITLNRPSALNALSLDMLCGLDALLRRCAADAGIRAVLLRGAGEKAFCAGGDVRALYDSVRTGGGLHREFFPREYRLDFFLHHYPKPCLALMDGITMGGGMGLAQGAALRIVGDRTRIAMPEVGIGLFPDVGASYFLSRLPGALGAYIALTGVQVRSADALYAGLADLYLGPEAIALLDSRLNGLAWTGDDRADIERCLRSLAASSTAAGSVTAAVSPAPLAALRPAIDAHFSQPTVPAILAALRAENRLEFAAWAAHTLTLLSSRSPTMLAVSLRQLRYGRGMSLADCFRMELGMMFETFAHGDFLEGVRAVIIDKDNAPRWRPERIEDVAETAVEAFFRDRWPPGAHPLAQLDAGIA